MLLGTDELTILRGSKFYGTWQWVNSVTGDPEDFAGLSASIKIKNIHEEFEDIKNVFEVGTAIIEPLDVDGNATKGRVDVSLSKADTLNFTIPQSEDDKYGESGFYAILEILLSTDEVILQAKVRIVESLESETLDFLLDERDEAIIINGKLDNILLRNDEYISTRDNLIDVVIPTTVQIITDLAADIQINKDEITLTKEDVLLMKDNVQNNKDSVESMKLAIETIFDDFDDRFLGVFNEDPLLDNDGEVLKEGTIYYNSIDKELKFYNSVSWDNPTAAAQTYALQASQYASDALASKDASKLSEDNAKLSEEVAIAKANAILNLTVEIQTLAPNELATSNYDATTGILTLKIPKGEKGEKGDSFIFEDFTPEQLSSLSASIIESNIPDLPITKITNLESTLNNKLNITDIQNTLLSIDTTKPLAAYQGKILKDLIDNINTLLASDDVTLDELQEVVNFIKQNKTDLQNLDLSNIAETTTLKHFTAVLKEKLDGIEDSANNYSHPSTHDASMINESTEKRFVSDSEKTTWDNKLDKSGGTMTGAITAIRETKVAMAANNIDLATGNLFTKTISAATTFTVSNVAPTGQTNSFILELTNAGSQVITWWAGMKWAGGTAPVLTASGVDILGFYSHDGGTTWRGVLMSKDSK